MMMMRERERERERDDDTRHPNPACESGSALLSISFPAGFGLPPCCTNNLNPSLRKSSLFKFVNGGDELR